MKITKERFNKIIVEEHERFKRSLNQDESKATEERKLAHILYLFLNEARDKFEQYLGTLQDGENPSDECQDLFDKVEMMWEMADTIVGGREEKDRRREPQEEERWGFGRDEFDEDY